MKKLLFVLSFFLIQNSFLFSQDGWFWQNPLPQGNDLYSISFFNSQNGFAIGEGNTILRTTTGGMNWTQLYDLSPVTLRKVYSTSSNTAFLVGDYGIILYTTNGGFNWVQQVSGTSSHLGDISFYDENNGVIVQGSGLLKTSNAGTDWSPITVGTIGIASVAYLSENTIIVVGYSQTGITHILKTSNGGGTWVSTFSIPFAWSNDISFKDSLNGIITFSNDVYRTTNGGDDWIYQTTGLQTTSLYNISYVVPNNAVAVGENGTIIYSWDGGINWMQQTSGTTENLRSVDMINANNGFVAGELGFILKTVDSGLTWQNQTLGTRTNLRSVSFVDVNLGIAVGDGGKIIKTNNGGTSWISQASGTTEHLRGISYINSNIATAVGENGIILRTTNSGNNWFSQASGTTNNLLGVSFTDVDYGVAVGENGTIIKTNNGGTTWTLQTSETSQQLNSVFFIDENNGSAVGGDWWTQEGIILRTTNGGINWTSQSIGIPDDLFGIYFTDINHGIAVGDDGTIVRTTDGGNSWINQPRVTYNTLWAVSFANQNDGLAIGTNSSQNIFSVILRTTNGGVDWITQNSLCANMLLGVSFVDSLAATAVGVGGAIIRTINGGYIPVELISFTAEVFESKVELNWSTATEINNQGFQIERRKIQEERSENWDRIGFVNGNGTTTKRQSYSFVDKNLEVGKYQYRLKQIDFDGTFEYSKIVEVEIAPTKFSLQQNYPNPFNPSTKISWQSPVSSWQTLKVYDILGNEVVTLVNEYRNAGSYEIEFKSSVGSLQLASGIYFYQFKAGYYVETKKMVLMK